MIKPTLFLLAVTLAFQSQAAPTSAMAYGGNRVLSAPAVESVALDAGQIILTGRFHGTGTPVLTLGKHRLEVSGANLTQVIAKLPQSLPPATYRLLVNHANTSANTTSLYLQIPQIQ